HRFSSCEVIEFSHSVEGLQADSEHILNSIRRRQRYGDGRAGGGKAAGKRCGNATGKEPYHKSFIAAAGLKTAHGPTLRYWTGANFSCSVSSARQPNFENAASTASA